MKVFTKDILVILIVVIMNCSWFAYAQVKQLKCPLLVSVARQIIIIHMYTHRLILDQRVKRLMKKPLRRHTQSVRKKFA